MVQIVCFSCLFKVLTWDVGKITPQKLPSLKGLVNLQSGAPKPEENPSLNIQFKIQQLAISGKDKFDLCLRVMSSAEVNYWELRRVTLPL